VLPSAWGLASASALALATVKAFLLEWARVRGLALDFSPPEQSAKTQSR
jgi:shikimate kinase